MNQSLRVCPRIRSQAFIPACRCGFEPEGPLLELNQLPTNYKFVALPK